MWVVEIVDRNKENGDSYILKGPVITIGRSVENDIQFNNDKSISRKHSKLTILSANQLIINDLSAKFGTKINGIALNKDNEIITSNCTISFGANDSIIKLYYNLFQFSMTRLNKEDKIFVQNILQSLNISIVNNVEDCTHLVTNSFSATVKSLLAIVMNKHIVTIDYIKSLDQSNAIVKVLDEENYLPERFHDEVHNVNDSRSSLMKDICILLIDRSHAEYISLIRHCGASVISLFDSNDSIDDEYICNYINNIKSKNTTNNNMKISVFIHELKAQLQSSKYDNIMYLTTAHLAISILQNQPPVLQKALVSQIKASSKLPSVNNVEQLVKSSTVNQQKKTIEDMKTIELPLHHNPTNDNDKLEDLSMDLDEPFLSYNITNKIKMKVNDERIQFPNNITSTSGRITNNNDDSIDSNKNISKVQVNDGDWFTVVRGNQRDELIDKKRQQYNSLYNSIASNDFDSNMFIQPLDIERNDLIISNIQVNISTNTSSSNQITNDKKRFRKNVIRSTAAPIIRSNQMDKLFPKESETERLLRIDFDAEENEEFDDKILFSERLKTNRKRK